MVSDWSERTCRSDCRGLELTTSSEGAAKHIDQAVTDYLDYGTTASGHVKAALEQDPAFVLAQCFRGYFLLMLENKAILPKVQQTLDEIRPNLGAATRRERLHVKALEAWAAGDIMKACFHWEEILTDCPLDLLALKLHHTMSFYAGRSQVMRSVVAGVLGEWSDAVPGLRLRAGHVRLRARRMRRLRGSGALGARGGRAQPRRSLGHSFRGPCAGNAGALGRRRQMAELHAGAMGARRIRSRPMSGGTPRCSSWRRASTTARSSLYDQASSAR